MRFTRMAMLVPSEAIPRASADAFERELATAAYPAARIGTINGHGSIRVRA